MPEQEKDRTAVASRVNEEFEAHDCETFAGKNWEQT
jgi:hypothetical protein